MALRTCVEWNRDLLQQLEGDYLRLDAQRIIAEVKKTIDHTLHKCLKRIDLDWELLV